MDRTIVVAALLIGCAGKERGALPDRPLTQAATSEEEVKASTEALALLQAAAVSDASYAHRVLYTWTSDVGLARMKSEKRLLLPTEREGFFVEEIDTLAAAGTSASADVARLLAQHSSFAAKRYAWTRPSATRVPLGDRSYGDHLVAVTLKSHAIVGRFDARDPVPFAFQDLDGQEIPIGKVLADPSRLAAVYHVSTDPVTGHDFREYVLVNESMIAEFSINTEAIAQKIATEARVARELARGAKLEQLWAASNAFDTPKHKPTRQNLETLARSLEAIRPGSPPVVVVPAVTFSPVAAGPPPVSPLPPNFGVKPKPWRKYVCD
jgi:hypothetical protein